MLEKIIEMFKSDLELAGCQLVLAGLKPACHFEVDTKDYPALDFKKNLFYKYQDKKDTNIHWYVFLHKKELEVYVVNRMQSKSFDDFFVDDRFLKNIDESCFEQMIMKSIWSNNADLFGISMGYPLGDTVEFQKEMANRQLRKDRSILVFHTQKDEIGFISYPENIQKSKAILDTWARHLNSLGVKTFTRDEWNSKVKRK